MDTEKASETRRVRNHVSLSSSLQDRLTLVDDQDFGSQPSRSKVLVTVDAFQTGRKKGREVEKERKEFQSVLL